MSTKKSSLPSGKLSPDLSEVLSRLKENPELLKGASCNSVSQSTFSDALQHSLDSYPDGLKSVHAEVIIELLEQVSESQDELKDMLEKEQQVARRESRKNTAILIFTALGVVVAGASFFVTAALSGL